jgi:hypothetical protein
VIFRLIEASKADMLLLVALRAHMLALPPLAKFALAMAIIVGVPPLARHVRLPDMVGLLHSSRGCTASPTSMARSPTPGATFAKCRMPGSLPTRPGTGSVRSVVSHPRLVYPPAVVP